MSDLQTGKMFDMRGYDVLAQVQHVTDDYTMLFVLHNNSTHVLLAEATAPPVRDMDGGRYHGGEEEPAKLVAAYRYVGEHDWRVAYKLALAEAVKLAHKGDDSCPGCGCRPGDGTTPGCTAPDGCGYFASCQLPVGGGRAEEKLHDIAVNPDARD